MRLLLVLATMALAGAPALAQSSDPVSPADAIPGPAGITYLDLLRQVSSDLTEVGGTYEGVLDAPLRSLFFADETSSEQFNVAFATVDAVTFSAAAGMTCWP